MSSVAVVDLFGEDVAHERFLRPLIHRLAQTEQLRVDVRVRSARGGHPRALAELTLYQRTIQKGGASAPDVLVVAIDANCDSYGSARRTIERKLARQVRGIAAIACPDPHIERWFMADPPSFREVVGTSLTLGRRKCDRQRYKRILAETVAKAGHPALLGGIEFAEEIVEAMDLYRAGKGERSLGHFVDEMTALLRRTAQRAG